MGWLVQSSSCFGCGGGAGGAGGATGTVVRVTIRSRRMHKPTAVASPVLIASHFIRKKGKNKILLYANWIEFQLCSFASISVSKNLI